jgi:hypothetical protein
MTSGSTFTVGLALLLRHSAPARSTWTDDTTVTAQFDTTALRPRPTRSDCSNRLVQVLHGLFGFAWHWPAARMLEAYASSTVIVLTAVADSGSPYRLTGVGARTGHLHGQPDDDTTVTVRLIPTCTRHHPTVTDCQKMVQVLARSLRICLALPAAGCFCGLCF